MLREVDLVPLYSNFVNLFQINPYETVDILEGIRGRLQYTDAGDILNAKSDFSSNTFDCHVSYREFITSF
jgi:hypothetical protein